MHRIKCLLYIFVTTCRRRYYSRRPNTSAFSSPSDSSCWSWTDSTSMRRGACRWNDGKPAATENYPTTDRQCMRINSTRTRGTKDDLRWAATASTRAVFRSRSAKM